MRRNPERRKARMLARWAERMAEPAYQPPKTNICGQIAVAAIVGRPLLEVLELCGHDHRTSTAEIRNLLEAYGFVVGKVQRRKPAGIALGVMRFPDTRKKPRPSGKLPMFGGHWVVMRAGETFDCTPRNIFQFDFYETGSVCSWLPIEPPEVPADFGTDVPLTKP